MKAARSALCGGVPRRDSALISPPTLMHRLWSPEAAVRPHTVAAGTVSRRPHRTRGAPHGSSEHAGSAAAQRLHRLIHAGSVIRTVTARAVGEKTDRVWVAYDDAAALVGRGTTLTVGPSSDRAVLILPPEAAVELPGDPAAAELDLPRVVIGVVTDAPRAARNDRRSKLRGRVQVLARGVSRHPQAVGAEDEAAVLRSPDARASARRS